MMNIRKGAFSAPGSLRYIAYVSADPAVMAGLYVHDDIGYLSGGATLPAFRKHGCHTALTQRRVLDAEEAGCDLIIGFAGTLKTCPYMIKRNLHSYTPATNSAPMG